MKKFLKITLLVTLISFLLNFGWEHLHEALYKDFATHIRGLPNLWWASIGDAFYTILLYLGMSLVNKKTDWLKNMDIKDVGLVISVSLLTAVGIENNALIKGRWAYNELMPIVPIFNVGLSPFLQLAILSLLTFFIVGWITGKSK